MDSNSSNKYLRSLYRHCSRLWGHSIEQGKQCFPSLGSCLLAGEKGNTQVQKLRSSKRYTENKTGNEMKSE